MRGSSWRKLPAAALRGLTSGLIFPSDARAFSL
jgi:hypothetical protein